MTATAVRAVRARSTLPRAGIVLLSAAALCLGLGAAAPADAASLPADGDSYTTESGRDYVFNLSLSECGLIAVGTQGSCVATAQLILNAVDGAGLHIDGRYGLASATAVRRYQADRGLTVDGVIGSQVRAAFASDYARLSAPTASPGASCPTAPQHELSSSVELVALESSAWQANTSSLPETVELSVEAGRSATITVTDTAELGVSLQDVNAGLSRETSTSATVTVTEATKRPFTIDPGEKQQIVYAANVATVTEQTITYGSDCSRRTHVDDVTVHVIATGYVLYEQVDGQVVTTYPWPASTTFTGVGHF